MQCVLCCSSVIVDLTPPEPTNSTGLGSQFFTASCRNFSLSKWASGCPPGDSARPNLRHLTDNSSSAQLLWAGTKRQAPLLWSRYNAFIQACFRPFFDLQSGLRGYSFCVGRQRCACDVVPPFDPHEGLAKASDWSHCATVLRPGLRRFAEGRYYFRLTALNRLNLASSLCHFRPYVIDTSAPTLDFVHSLRFDPKLRRFSARLGARDLQSGLRSVRVGLGRSRHDTSLLPLRQVKVFGGEDFLSFSSKTRGRGQV